MSVENSSRECPCGSKLFYKRCCERFHNGEISSNSLELMRSRYSAYALGLTSYIIQTTHPASPQYQEDTRKWERQINAFSQRFEFKRLEILKVAEWDQVAAVLFAAHLKEKDTAIILRENSYFEKTLKGWLYRNGQLLEDASSQVLPVAPSRPLALAYYDDPILRRKANPIPLITPEIQELAENMIVTMDTCDGLGLAAPQIHQSLQLFVTRVPIDLEDGKTDRGKAKIFINPRLSLRSQEVETMTEGCLSIPTILFDVWRPLEISVEYLNLEGATIQERCSGLEARVIQHEYDHLQGILFIDHLKKRARKEAKLPLQHLQKRIYEVKN